ncbi:hypothetical protein [Brucella intermedia]|uniref:hypothetical protein n=1 Tax=Brucella intermedia TaxID=94625 RepID=UPI00235EFCFA|nr:hypothetical protein [Brucella intermedia]
MLSESLRSMRHELLDMLMEDVPHVEVSVLKLQSYALALGMYEDAAIVLEQKLNVQDTPNEPANSTVVLFRDYQKSRPQLHVVQVDGNDIA